MSWISVMMRRRMIHYSRENWAVNITKELVNFNAPTQYARVNFGHVVSVTIKSAMKARWTPRKTIK